MNRGTVNEVTVVGYPAADGYDGLHQEFCTDTTVPTPVPRDMISADCPHVRQGSSGGPWLIDYDPAEEIGDIYGVTSISTGRFTATPRFDQRTLDFVVLMNQLAAARP
ncbi:hypothetical protein [Streptomyces sp. NPDC018693]|uniref:hypothetical protein n=1 Tax=unclassified Streptomyces TaxID=2593676 RepID=UPI0037A395CF